MKHPALARLFSIALAILCVIMLLAGAFGISGAQEDNKGTLADYDRLQGRIEEYNTVTQALEGTISYEEANKALQELQERHDSDVSQHRSDLAMHTATRGGLTQGADALWEAQAQLDEAWKQYNEGAAKLEALEKQLTEGLEQVKAGQAELEEMQKQLPTLKMVFPMLLRNLNEAVGNIGDLKTEWYPNSQPGEGEKGETDNGNSSGDEQETEENSEDNSNNGGDTGGESGFWGLSRSSAETEYQNLLKACATYNQTIASLAQVSPELAEMAAMFQPIDTAPVMAVMNSWTEDPIRGPVLENTLTVFATYKQNVTAAADGLNSLPGTIEKTLEENAAMLAETEAQILAGLAGVEQGKAALPQAKAALEQGNAQIYDGLTQIWYQLGVLDDETEELRQNKETLEQESEELAAMAEEARQQRNLEKRQTSLRVMLLDRDGIETRYNEGMELIESANAYSEELLRQAEEEYQTRFAACILMIIGGLAGILHIPSAFEKIKSRFVLIAPVLVCLGCAVGAEVIFETMGRGSSYSAIFAAIFAAVQLLVVAPKAKKPGASA